MYGEDSTCKQAFADHAIARKQSLVQRSNIHPKYIKIKPFSLETLDEFTSQNRDRTIIAYYNGHGAEAFGVNPTNTSYTSYVSIANCFRKSSSFIYINNACHGKQAVPIFGMMGLLRKGMIVTTAWGSVTGLHLVHYLQMKQYEGNLDGEAHQLALEDYFEGNKLVARKYKLGNGEFEPVQLVPKYVLPPHRKHVQPREHGRIVVNDPPIKVPSGLTMCRAGAHLEHILIPSIRKVE